MDLSDVESIFLSEKEKADRLFFEGKTKGENSEKIKKTYIVSLVKAREKYANNIEKALKTIKKNELKIKKFKKEKTFKNLKVESLEIRRSFSDRLYVWFKIKQFRMTLFFHKLFSLFPNSIKEFYLRQKLSFKSSYKSFVIYNSNKIKRFFNYFSNLIKNLYESIKLFFSNLFSKFIGIFKRKKVASASVSPIQVTS